MTSDKESQTDNRGSHSVKISITTAAQAGHFRRLALLHFGSAGDSWSVPRHTQRFSGHAGRAWRNQFPARCERAAAQGKRGTRITVTVRAENWVWQALGIAPDVGR